MERRVTRSSSRSSPTTTPSPPTTTTRRWHQPRTPEKLTQRIQAQDSDKENAPPYKNTSNENTNTVTEETCGICLDGVKEKGELNCCTHAFCFECIFQWSKTSNTCPLCKARFVSLRKQGEGKSKRGKQYKVQDVDHRQDDSDFDGWISSDDDEYMDDWEDLEDGPDDFFMFTDPDALFYTDPFFIDLTEGDEDEDDVQIDDEDEDDEDASEGEEECENAENDNDESSSDNVSEGDDEFEVPETPQLRRSTRLQRVGDQDVEMEDGESSPVVTTGAPGQRQPVNSRRTSLRSSGTSSRGNTPQTARTRSRSTRNSPTTTTTRTTTTTITTTANRRTRTTSTTTTTTPRAARHARREEAKQEETGTRKSARLAARN